LPQPYLINHFQVGPHRLATAKFRLFYWVGPQFNIHLPSFLYLVYFSTWVLGTEQNETKSDTNHRCLGALADYNKRIMF
jgi:hypothetical protein